MIWNVFDEKFNQDENVMFDIIEEKNYFFAINIKKIDFYIKKGQQNKIKI